MTVSLSGSERLDERIREVVSRDLCSGCGACTLLDSGLDMRENEAGYLRPVRSTQGMVDSSAEATFRKICPGVTVSSTNSYGSKRHPVMGSYREMWVSWALDSEMRHRGSSGGVLTALSAWLLESGRAARVVGARAAPDPRRSIPVTITTRAEALAAAGSRYTPVATLSAPDVLLANSAVVAKPCEASALSSLVAPLKEQGIDPLILSFFCAGTPSAIATDRLLFTLGVESTTPLEELWYRGHGWPGRFTARDGATTVSAGYDESWGSALGPTTQWRCKVCPDGVGESADIVAADYWQVDGRGYPMFNEGDGTSALIARTERGADVIRAAAAAGIIHIEIAEMDSLAAVQPLQRDRRSFLAARILGSILAGRATPVFRGFGLIRLSLRHPLRAMSVSRGTYSRIRRARNASV